MNENIKHLNGDFEVARAEAERLAEIRRPYEPQIAKWKAIRIKAEQAIKDIENEIELKLRSGNIIYKIKED